MAKATPVQNHTIEVNSVQLRIIRDALNLYTRIGLGQFERIVDVYDPRTGAEMEAIVRFLKDAKLAAGFPANGSYGINHPNVSNSTKTAYDMSCQCNAAMDGFSHPAPPPALKGTEPVMIVTTKPA